MTYRFENLDIWKLARIFVNLIYLKTKLFPKDELFCLVSQMRRAALSILLNITEGSDRKSDVEFVRFLRIAFTSMEEVIAAGFIALDQRYFTQIDLDEICKNANILGLKINALIKYLQSSNAGSFKKNASRLNSKAND